MKKLLYFSLVLVCFQSCKQEEPAYFDGENYYRFALLENNATESAGQTGTPVDMYSPATTIDGEVVSTTTGFKFQSSQQDSIVYFQIQAIGFPITKDSRISLKQKEYIPREADRETRPFRQAIPGQDYVPVDDPSMVEYLVFPAGTLVYFYPVKLLKNPTSSGEMDIYLALELEDTSDFRVMRPAAFGTGRVLYTQTTN